MICGTLKKFILLNPLATHQPHFNMDIKPLRSEMINLRRDKCLILGHAQPCVSQSEPEIQLRFYST